MHRRPKMTREERAKRTARNERRGRTLAVRRAKLWERRQQEKAAARAHEQRRKNRRFW